MVNDEKSETEIDERLCEKFHKPPRYKSKDILSPPQVYPLRIPIYLINTFIVGEVNDFFSDHKFSQNITGP